MKPRKLRLVAEVSGFPTVIAEVSIKNFASEPELKDWTELVCPTCKKPTKYHGAIYECEGCKTNYNWWGKLLRVIKGFTTPLQMPRLIAEGQQAVGKLYRIDRAEFAAKYVDAAKKDYGIISVDDGTAHNLFKLLVASSRANIVIVAKWNDTTEQVIALLKVLDSNRIVLQEIIPKNLAKIQQTLMLNATSVTEEEVIEAQAFVECFLPLATEQVFSVSDYRTQFIEGHIEEKPEEAQSRVADIRNIMKAVLVPQNPSIPKKEKILVKVPSKKVKKK